MLGALESKNKALMISETKKGSIGCKMLSYRPSKRSVSIEVLSLSAGLIPAYPLTIAELDSSGTP